MSRFQKTGKRDLNIIKYKSLPSRFVRKPELNHLMLRNLKAQKTPPTDLENNSQLRRVSPTAHRRVKPSVMDETFGHKPVQTI